MSEISALEEHCEGEGCKLGMAEKGRAGSGLASGASFGPVTAFFTLEPLFLVMLSGMWDLSPSTRDDGTCTPHAGSSESYPLGHQGSPSNVYQRVFIPQTFLLFKEQVSLLNDCGVMARSTILKV